MSSMNDRRAAVLACAVLRSDYRQHLAADPVSAAADTGLEETDIKQLLKAAAELRQEDVSIKELALRLGAENWDIT